MRNFSDKALAVQPSCYRYELSANLTGREAIVTKERLVELVTSGRHHLMLDATRTSSVDIAGINVLVQVYKEIRACNGSIVISLYRDSPLAAMLHLTKFDKWFNLTFIQLNE